MTAQTSEGRGWPIAIILLAVVAVLQVGGIALQAGVLNPTAQSNRTDLRTQGAEIRAVACAQAESTANAFRFRQIGPNGKTESREHFVTRMLAQKHTLEAAQGIGCHSAKGFPPFERQVARALHEIAVILGADHQMHHRTAAARGPLGESGVLSAAQGGDASDAQPGHSQPGRHEGGSGEAGRPEHHAPPVSGEHGGSGGGVPSSAPSSPPTSSSSQSSSSQTTERTTESTVVETAPSAPVAPVTEGIGKVLEGVGTTVQETGEAVDETVHGVTCTIGIACPK